MVRIASGNLLRAEVDALVNTVNTVGVMGKGVAYQFKQAFPANYKAYEAACKRDEVVIGKMFVTFTGQLEPRLIINFPTKKHWKGNSKIKDIEAGLQDLVRVIQVYDIRSIAIPPLGCGLGGLRWEDVRPLIEKAFNDLPSVEVLLFEPGQAVAPEDRIVNTPRPEMTAWRAALIKVVDAYRSLGSDATHIEAQKLLYFLVVAGEPLKTNFAKGTYGPYDEKMRHALQAMDGHYVAGFGEGARLGPVMLKDGAVGEADTFLDQVTDRAGVSRRIQRVISLISGFESPYGLELLATVHWVVEQDGARTLGEVVTKVQDWNERKRKVMNSEHLRITLERLQEENWLSAEML